MNCPHCGEPIEMEVTLADRVAESMRVYWETRDWTAVQFRQALVDARLR